MDAVEFTLKKNQLDIKVNLPDGPVQGHWQLMKPHIETPPEENLSDSSPPDSLTPKNFDPQRLPKSLRKDILDFLTKLPNINRTDTQQSLISGAYLGNKITQNILYDKPPCSFFSWLIDYSKAYGLLDDGRDPLEAVLEAAKDMIGSDKRKEADFLIRELRKFHRKQEERKEHRRYHEESREFSSMFQVPNE